MLFLTCATLIVLGCAVPVAMQKSFLRENAVALAQDGAAAYPDMFKTDPPMFTEAIYNEALSEVYGAGFLASSAKNDVDDATMRPMSLTQLENVLAFFTKAMAKSNGKVAHTNLAFGKGCKNDKGKFCMSSTDCADGAACEAGREVTLHDVDMNILAAQLVIPSTYGSGKEISWSSKVQNLSQANDTNTYMTSHNWGSSFKGYVSAIQAHYDNHVKADDKTKDNTFYWVCTFANRQMAPGRDIDTGMGGADVDFATVPFGRVLDRVKKLVLVQDDSKPDRFMLSRGWCVFELHHALRDNVPDIVFACGNGALLDVNGATPKYVGGHKCDSKWEHQLESFGKSQASAGGEGMMDKIWAYMASKPFNGGKGDDNVVSYIKELGGHLATGSIAAPPDTIYASTYQNGLNYGSPR